MCIEAARYHLESGELDAGLPENDSANYFWMAGNSFTGFTVWFTDIESAKDIAPRMLRAIQELLPTPEAGRPGSSNDPPPVFKFQ